jgi:hypothetical protein
MTWYWACSSCRIDRTVDVPAEAEAHTIRRAVDKQHLQMRSRHCTSYAVFSVTPIFAPHNEPTVSLCPWVWHCVACRRAGVVNAADATHASELADPMHAADCRRPVEVRIA